MGDVKLILSYYAKETQPHTFDNIPIVRAVHKEASGAFEKFFHEQNFKQQVRVVFFALHPVSNTMQYSIGMLGQIRVLLLIGSMFLSLSLSALFFTASGAAAAEDAPPECKSKSTTRAILIGIMSAMMKAVPIVLVRHFHKRKFHRKPEGW